MARKALPLSKVYGLLEPGPGPGVAGHDRRQDEGEYHEDVVLYDMEFEPPTVGCVISNRNYTFNILKSTRECVIGIPTLESAEKVVGCGNSSGRKIDKFKVFGLMQVTASCVLSA